MNFPNFIQQLKERLSRPLPGEAAQFKMAPARRLTIEEYYELGNRNPRNSAVLISLYPFQDSVLTALMLRPSEQGVHSDQVSFPGGRFEKTDIDLQTTALREAHEELGIVPGQVEVIGQLTKIYIPVSNSMVHPFVGAMKEKPSFIKNELEVHSILEADLFTFLDESIKGNGLFPSRNGLQIEAPYYEWASHRIWGATAMMISELMEIVREIV